MKSDVCSKALFVALLSLFALSFDAAAQQGKDEGPDIYEQAEKCTETGLPMMRALYLEYPDDRNVRYVDDEYLFGDSLLVAPILKPLSKTDIREIYLPKGTWFDYFTKEKIESTGMWITRKVDLKTMPFFFKRGYRSQVL